MSLINFQGTKSLHAVVNGDTINDSFYVDYSTAHTVEDLRGVIVSTMSNLDSFQNSTLRDIDMERLQLWKVIIPPGLAISPEEMEQEVILLDNLNIVKTKLELTEILGDVFSEANNVTTSVLTFAVVKVVD